MRTKLALTFTTCALALTAFFVPMSAVAVEAASARGTTAMNTADRDEHVHVYLSCYNRRVTLNWYRTYVASSDWVALYDQDPRQVGLTEYVPYAWQWARYGYSYQTYIQGGRYWIAYITYDAENSRDVIIAQRGPKTLNC